jgi:hypothetical protein
MLHRHKHHPHRHYFDLYNYPVISPFDYFDTFFNKGFFSDFDLPLYGFSSNMLSDFGRLEDEFFGEEEFNRFNQLQDRPKDFQIAKSVRKHTHIENGQRVTVTEINRLDPDGKTYHEVKEETDDGKGNRQVRYLDQWPEKLPQIGQQTQQGQIGQQSQQGQVGQQGQQSHQGQASYQKQQGQQGQQSHEQALGKEQGQGQSHKQEGQATR